MKAFDKQLANGDEGRVTRSDIPDIPAPLRLRIDGDALVANWRTWARLSGPAECGAAIKADGYGLGAREVMARLHAAGCRTFFVATWAEAAALDPWPQDVDLCVLHGVRAADMSAALASRARPVLNSPEQVARWRETGRPCDVMVDTGMNRLGLTPEQATSGLLDGLEIDTLHSHLACADVPEHSLNLRQLEASRALSAAIRAGRYGLANSAGVLLGAEYAFDLTRPGLALYGGVPGPGGAAHVRPVARPEAEILQVREVEPRDSVGYGATWTATDRTRVGILNLGYADGILRALGPGGTVDADGSVCSILGRVSMDLMAVDLTGVDAAEGDWAALAYDLPTTAARTGFSQYELLTNLARRLERYWNGL